MSLPDRLKTDLLTAMKGGDRLAVITLRGLIAAIDNAGAVDVQPGPYEMKSGLGHDVARRPMSSDDILQILQAECDDLEEASREYAALGQDGRAGELAARAAIVNGYLE